MALIVPLVVSCQEPAGQAGNQGGGQQGPMQVRVVTPEERSLKLYREYTGRFEAAKRVDIKARVSGYIKSVAFEDGDLVDQGETLFIIDPDPFQIEAAASRARYELAQNDLDRAEELRTRGNISQDLLEERREQVVIAKAAMEQAELNLSYTQVKAPFAGRVSRNYADEGTLITGGNSSGTLLTILVSVDPIHFYFQGTEQDVLRYARASAISGTSETRGRGLPVDIRLLDEEGFVHPGRIDFTDNRLDRSTATKDVRATVPNPDGLLEPGMFGRLRVAPEGEVTRLLVDETLILAEQTRRYVYIVGPENRAQRAYVALGMRTDDGMVVVEEGLTPDAQVVAGNLQFIQPGMPLNPVRAQAASDRPTGQNQGSR